MRSMFFNISTSSYVSNLSVDYNEKYVRVYKLKKNPLIEFW